MPARRMLILTDGQLDPFSAKTAAGLLRYCPDEVVGILDAHVSGISVAEALGVAHEAPLVSSLQEGLALNPNQLVIGVVPQGGALKPEWRAILLEAIEAGLDIVSGMHAFLQDDQALREAAARAGVRLYDTRRPPSELPIGRALAKQTRAVRIVTIGTDCNVGKMLVSLEIKKALQKQGMNAGFIATGQTGIMIEGKGIAIDRVISDFAAGAVEQLVMQEAERDVLMIEGQGSLLHPGFSAVTLGLLHGSLPDGVIVCHQPGREHMRGTAEPIVSLQSHIHLCQALCAPLHPVNVLGVAINGYGLRDEELQQEIARASQETGLPATDVIRMGADILVDRVMGLLHKEQVLPS